MTFYLCREISWKSWFSFSGDTSEFIFCQLSKSKRSFLILTHLQLQLQQTITTLLFLLCLISKSLCCYISPWCTNMTDKEFTYNSNDLQLCASWHKKNINRIIEYKDKEQRTNPLNNHEDGKEEDFTYTKCLELFSQHSNHFRRKHFEGLLSNQEELNKRFKKFISNVAFIVKHNNNNNHHHKIGLNQFSDLYEHEFPFLTSKIADFSDLGGISHRYDEGKANFIQYLSVETLEKSKIVFGHDDDIPVEGMEKKKQKEKREEDKREKKRNNNHKSKKSIYKTTKTSVSLIEKADKYEEYLDWSSRINPDKVNIVHDSQDQGSCGSCWAFASTGTVEASVARNIAWNTYAQQFYLASKIYEKKKAKKIASRGARMAEEEVMPIVNLSVQELIDCDIDHNMGCVGGSKF